MHHLFPHSCHPMATEQTTGAFRFGWQLMAIDAVIATPAHAQDVGRLSCGKHQSPFLQGRCVLLAEVGTHTMVDAVFTPCPVAEPCLIPVLLSRSVHADRLVVMDRGVVSAVLVRLRVQ